MGYIATSYDISIILSVYIPGVFNILSIIGALTVLYIYKRYSFLRMNTGKLIQQLMLNEIIINLTSFFSLFYFGEEFLMKFQEKYKLNPLENYPFPYIKISSTSWVCFGLGFIRTLTIYFYYLLVICIAHNLYFSLRQKYSMFRQRFRFYYIISLSIALGMALCGLLQKEMGYFSGRCELKYSILSSIFCSFALSLSYVLSVIMYIYAQKQKMNEIEYNENKNEQLTKEVKNRFLKLNTRFLLVYIITRFPFLFITVYKSIFQDIFKLNEINSKVNDIVQIAHLYLIGLSAVLISIVLISDPLTKLHFKRVFPFKKKHLDVENNLNEQFLNQLQPESSSVLSVDEEYDTDQQQQQQIQQLYHGQVCLREIKLNCEISQETTKFNILVQTLNNVLQYEQQYIDINNMQQQQQQQQQYNSINRFMYSEQKTHRIWLDSETPREISCISYGQKFFRFQRAANNIQLNQIQVSFDLKKNCAGIEKIHEGNQKEFSTWDNQFRIKIVSKQFKKEAIQGFLAEYNGHISEHPSSYLTRIYGLYTIQGKNKQNNINFILSECIPLGILNQMKLNQFYHFEFSNLDVGAQLIIKEEQKSLKYQEVSSEKLQVLKNSHQKDVFLDGLIKDLQFLIANSRIKHIVHVYVPTDNKSKSVHQDTVLDGQGNPSKECVNLYAVIDNYFTHSVPIEKYQKDTDFSLDNAEHYNTHLYEQIAKCF